MDLSTFIKDVGIDVDIVKLYNTMMLNVVNSLKE